MMRLGILLVGALACSRPHDRERDHEAPAPVSPPRDAPIDATPGWIQSAVTHGGPGLCASIGERDLLIMRRDASGRLIETLAFDPVTGSEPAERVAYAYDATGRPTQKLEKGTTHHTFDTLTELTYDASGRITRRREHHDDTSSLGGDVNVTYRWTGKPVARPSAHFLPREPEDPTDPIPYALPFSGTVAVARYYDGSRAPQPQSESTNTYDQRGRLVRILSTGWSDPSRDQQLEWDADDQLVAIRVSGEVTSNQWRDHHLVAIRYVDRSGKETARDVLRYDAAGRLVERLVFVPGPRERITSSKIDPTRNELVTTTVVEDSDGPTYVRTYRYDCGPPLPGG